MQAELSAGAALGITGTPAIFVNGKLQTLTTYDALAAEIRSLAPASSPAAPSSSPAAAGSPGSERLRAAMTAGRSGPAATGLALVGLAIAAYLALTRLSGGLPVCGPLHGCETVALSSYSEIFGIPVAVFGVALLDRPRSAWRSPGGGAADRRALLGLYGLGLLGVLFVAYLTYLELFVIGAVCVWCAGYALTVVAGWIIVAQLPSVDRTGA